LRWLCAVAGTICNKTAAHAAESVFERNDTRNSPDILSTVPWWIRSL
jgi:hypothetical protein